jgi:hypothetical protein
MGDAVGMPPGIAGPVRMAGATIVPVAGCWPVEAYAGAPDGAIGFIASTGSRGRPPAGNSSWRRTSAPTRRLTADSTLITIDHITRNGLASTTPAMSRTIAASTSAALMRITGVLR